MDIGEIEEVREIEPWFTVPDDFPEDAPLDPSITPDSEPIPA